MTTDGGSSWGYATSTGLAFTHPTIVDAHFDACREAYSGLLADVGIAPGWHVLDAGCGSGSFVPLIADVVGAAGRVTAVDLAAENVAALRHRVARTPPRCPVSVVRASLLRLPYPDDSFDAAWCANTVQYFDDGQLAAALAELRRVVRPGGLVAVKDIDAALITAWPGDPFLFSDFFRFAAATSDYARQLLRSAELHRWLRAAGLDPVRQRTELIEHFAPHPPAARRFYRSSCAQLAQQATRLGAPGDWSALADPEDPRHPLAHPHSYIREGNVLCVGSVPG
ncbi:class I SAM-dependent methyltransferase [Micromonospora sp. KC207]|uniref:class I SAM-dependent methyltransferase n=1 Tax=Micromonospora sp. KC207 TaxID=2530377 RepID=UPI0010440FB2|nr:class I SAM-dependent methyltransferase [Micromonospora sp. KC207]TDC52093.1 class I SAM-dependent methyltransferase [Micromonospora sp. KC207]